MDAGSSTEDVDAAPEADAARVEGPGPDAELDAGADVDADPGAPPPPPAVACPPEPDAGDQDAGCDDEIPEYPAVPVCVNGMTFRVRIGGPAEGEAVLLLHGFPEGSYEWRAQIKALASAGYRVIAPDQRGYSPGARPTDVSAYTIVNVVGDALGLLEVLGVKRFHVVGHDWGAAPAWGLGLAVPDRVLSLTMISIAAPGAMNREIEDPTSCQYSDFSYFDTFVKPDSEDLFLAGNGLVLRAMFSEVGADAECHYVAALNSKPAMRAAMNWYRANVANRQLLGASDTPVTVPTMLIWGDQDPFVCRPSVDLTSQFVTGPYRLEVLPKVDHWVPEVASDRVSVLLLDHFASFRDR